MDVLATSRLEGLAKTSTEIVRTLPKAITKCWVAFSVATPKWCINNSQLVKYDVCILNKNTSLL